MNSNNDPSIEEVLQEKDSEKQKQKYNDYVSNITPKSNRFLNCAKAFLVGGAICVVEKALTVFISISAMIRSWRGFIPHYL